MLDTDSTEHEGKCGKCGKDTNVRKYRHIWMGPVCAECAATLDPPDDAPEATVQQEAAVLPTTRQLENRRLKNLIDADLKAAMREIRDLPPRNDGRMKRRIASEPAIGLFIVSPILLALAVTVGTVKTYGPRMPWQLMASIFFVAGLASLPSAIRTLFRIVVHRLDPHMLMEAFSRSASLATPDNWILP